MAPPTWWRLPCLLGLLGAGGALGYQIQVTRDPYDQKAVAWVEEQTEGPVGRLDLVFIVDNTGSMSGQIQSTKDALLSIIETLQASPLAKAGALRVGAVSYIDYNEGRAVASSHDLSSDFATVSSFVGSMSADGGGDWPEAVGYGLMRAANLSWGQGHARTAILIADAPPHGVVNDRPKGAIRWEDSLEVLKEMGVVTHSLLWNTDLPTVQAFRHIAAETGGMFQILTGNWVIGPIAVCVGESGLDLLYLTSRVLAIVDREASELFAITSDQLRTQYLWAAMQDEGLQRFDVASSGDRTPEMSFALRYRPLDYEDVATTVRLMSAQPAAINPCVKHSLFCATPSGLQPARGLLPLQTFGTTGDMSTLTFRPPASPFQLDFVHINASVSGGVAEVELVQGFVSNAETALQSEYIFPLSPRAAVHAFQASIDGTVLVGVVKEKAQAQKEYDEAVDAGKIALMLSAAEDVSQNTFRVAVGNIPAGASVRIMVRYVVELELIEQGSVARLVIPTSVVPPFSVAPTAFSADSNPETSPVAGSYVMVIRVVAEGGSQALVISSPSHQALLAISTSEDGAGVNQTVALLQPAVLLQDVLMNIPVGHSGAPGVVCQAWPSTMIRPVGVPEFAMLLRPAPDLLGPMGNLAEKKVHLLIDASASMARSSAVAQSREVAAEVLKALSSAITDGSQSIGELRVTVSFLGKASPRKDFVLTSAGALDSALAFVYSGVAGADGGTDISSALMQVIGGERVLVTDGIFSDLGLLFEVLRLTGGRVHSIGVGATAYRASLRDLAEATGGIAEFLAPGQAAAGVASVMARACLGEPAAEVVPLIDAPTATIAKPFQSVEFVPPRLSGILDGRQVSLFTLFDVAVSNDSSLAAKVDVGNFYSLPVSWAASLCLNGTALHTAAARRAVQSLEIELTSFEAQLRELGTPEDATGEAMQKVLEGKVADTKSAILDYGLKYSLATSQTSFLIVEEDKEEEEKKEEDKHIDTTPAPSSSPADGAAVPSPSPPLGAPSAPESTEDTDTGTSRRRRSFSGTEDSVEHSCAKSISHPSHYVAVLSGLMLLLISGEVHLPP